MPRVIVSFTTIPSRIALIKPMLESLLNQTSKPDRIVLWLPKICKKENKYYTIPPNFMYWMIQNNIMILNCDKDWGPATKLVPTLQEITDPETIIITVDDDISYESHFIEELLIASKRWPNDCLGFMGGVPVGWVWENESGFIHAEHLFLGNVERTQVAGLGGYRGIMYRRKMFDVAELVNELEFLSKDELFVTDDQLFQFYLTKRGIKSYVIKTNWPGHGKYIINARTLGLGNGIHDDKLSSLAPSSFKRLVSFYQDNGWIERRLFTA